MRETGWDISLNVSMVELYNEDLRDLLTPPGANTSTSAPSSSNKLKISYQSGRVAVAGLTSVVLESHDVDRGMDELDTLLEQAARTRSTASTGMNETSSRSHALFMLEVVCRHADGSCLYGALRLCDLAGSERLDRTGTLHDSARLKETVNINKSLSCLADVFMALANKAPHIPFRNSKLTLLLQVQ